MGTILKFAHRLDDECKREDSLSLAHLKIDLKTHEESNMLLLRGFFHKI